CSTPVPSDSPTATATVTESPTDTATMTPSPSATVTVIPTPPPTWSFTDVTTAAGLNFEHRYQTFLHNPQVAMFMGGVAAEDYDRDGFVDLYISGTEAMPGKLFHNRGDGTFEEVGAAAGVAVLGRAGGPAWADLDGDGWLDLFVGGLEGTPSRAFHNCRGGPFEDGTARTRIDIKGNAVKPAVRDHDPEECLQLVGLL